nr:sulfatase-like hydrolase/transferase [uncultured Sphingobacterium sp.]
MIKLKGSFAPYLGLLIRFLILLLIYAFLRLGFYGINYALFPHVNSAQLLYMLWGGVKFDIVALLYLNILYLLMQIIPAPFKYNTLYQKIAKWIFIITNSIGIALNLVDFAYYPFTLKRTTGTVFDQFANEKNLGSLALDFCLDYWYLFILFAILVYALIKLYDLVQVQRPLLFRWPTYSIQSACFLIAIFLFIGGVRGGWAHSTRPITLSNAGDYVTNPEEMNIVLNTPFSLMKTLKAVNLKPIHTYTEQELTTIYNPVHYPQSKEPFKKMNVVFLILESFAKEHFGELNKDIQGGQYKGYTPFLDSLIREGYTFEHTYANGRKSIDALPSVITGIPSVGEPFVLSVYSGNKTTSIANLLANKGYETAFFHGAPNGSMGFSAYMKLAGIQHYYGKNEYNNDADFDGIWGIWDEPFMQYMANEINSFKQPFFASFFSLSSHHPFKVPSKYEGVFPKGPLPVQEPIGYTDNALRQFFKTASSMSWYKNTLFVICADHATVSALPEYQTAANSYAIPIILYHPGGDLKGRSDKLAQQIDIMPTVLNYLNYDKPYFAFGFDALNPTKENFVVNNNSGIFNFYYKDYLLINDGIKNISLHNLKEDRLMKHDLLKQPPLVLDTMETKFKAFEQQYNNRMIENKLIYDGK